ncbi:MAG: glycosyltransferase [Dehalococcoidia bacterium]|jgi:glycosyltransferase involved in cell wall biosynthesis
MNNKLAVITTHPIQYQAPLWRSLAREIDIHVYFGSDFSIRGSKDEGFGVHFSWDVPLTEGYPHTFLSIDPGINRPGDLRLNMAQFKQKLLEFQPDYALLTGYSPLPFYLKALLTLRLLGIPILLRAETTDLAVQRSASKRFGRNVFLKILYSQIAGFLAIGYNSRHHYRSRGIPENRIYHSPYNIDDELFAKQIKDYDGRRTEIRRELGFDEDQFVFIFSGKLIPKKNPLMIVDALRLLPADSGVSLGLIVMGDGLLRRQFEAGMQALPEIETVFTGFQNQSKLGLFYSAVDCLVLPSSWSETWGLVVNEALQFGMPVIVSDRVGCWRDLVTPAETGYVFPAGDAAALADCMSRVISLSKLRGNGVREACRQKASEYSVERAVAGIRKCLLALPQGS